MADPHLLVRVAAVAAGGAAGAVTRFALARLLWRWGPLPWGTLAANVLGCLLIGFGVSWFERHPDLSEAARLLALTGFLGALTTFSTFSYETLRLASAGDWRTALWNVAWNLVLGFGAVLIGLQLGR